MKQKGMIVVCATDVKNHSWAMFEVENRCEATKVRKLLYTLLPPDCHSSVNAWVETRQHYTERCRAISERTGLPSWPVRWFMLRDKLPDRFEDLQIDPYVLQSYLEEHREAIRKKPCWYSWLPVAGWKP